MAAIDWPTTLPQYFEFDGFNRTKTPQVITSNNSTGPPQTRRRTTANETYNTGVMTMTKAQLVIFEDFVDNTIKGGALVFNFPDPLTRTSVEVRLVIPNEGEPYSSNAVGWDYYDVGFAVATQPS